MNTIPSQDCPQCGAPLDENAPAGLCPKCLMALNLKTETAFTDDTTKPAAPLPPEAIAPHFPQLEILECLGRGGMGVVYKARQKTLNRLVALKLLAPERVRDAKFAERFAREAQALAALNHPNIVTVYDFGKVEPASSLLVSATETGRMPVPLYYLVMEFVDGANLRQLLRAQKFTPEEALAIVPPLCEALQFAHERGIVHRDIKPENLLLDKDGRVKIADFGIAKMLGADGRAGSPQPAASTPAAEGGAPGVTRPANAPAAAALTGEGTIGTPGYFAPEQQTDPQRVDSRADIYSLGVVFYEMLTGELPGKPIEPPSRKVHVDVRIDEIVLRALEKEPELRFQTAAELKTDVETITHMQGATRAASSADAASRLQEVCRQVKGPAMGLAVVGLLNWIAIPLIFFVTLYVTSQREKDSPWLLVVPLAALFLSSVMLAAGFKMRRLQAYRLAITGSILAILISPGNLIGLPVGIWALVVLSQRDVRAAFGTRHPLSAPDTVPSRRHGDWKLATVIAAAVLFLLSLPVGYFLLAYVIPRLPAHQAGPTFVVKGTVNDAVTGQPIAQARVDDNRYGASPTTTPQHAWTDASGHYELKTWYEEHNLAASAPGYETQLEILLTRPFGREREARIDFRLQPAPEHEAEAASAMTFGPVVRCELLGGESLSNCFLDLDTGRISSAPPELVNSLRAKGQLYGGAPPVEVIRGWLRSNGVDVIKRSSTRPEFAVPGIGALTHATETFLNQVDGTTMFMADKVGEHASPNAFDTLPPQRVVAAVKEAERVLAEGPGSREPRTFALPPQLVSAVKTREGAIALVEILDNDPRSGITRLRYKQVQATRPPPAGLEAGYQTVRVTRGNLTQGVTATGSLNPTTNAVLQWQIVAAVAEADIAQVETGADVEFTVDAFPERRFHGKVMEVSNAPTNQNNVVSYLTTVHVSDPELKFRPGMTAYLNIISARREAVLRIPMAALRFRPAGTTPDASRSIDAEGRAMRTVGVLRGSESSRLEAVRIRTGISDGQFIEVTEGLNEGDRVVTAAKPSASTPPR